jgi:hypothetical protein
MNTKVAFEFIRIAEYMRTLHPPNAKDGAKCGYESIPRPPFRY